jgi:putative ABC transport system permease protein
MAFGAVFGALNTMYAAVSARRAEIGTLMALGFSRTSVLVSFLVESLLLAGLGGLLGCLLALPVNGVSTGTTNWTSFSEVAFRIRVLPGMMAAGLAFALVMGAVGGFFPALNAARGKIAESIRRG